MEALVRRLLSELPDDKGKALAALVVAVSRVAYELEAHHVTTARRCLEGACKQHPNGACMAASALLPVAGMLGPLVGPAPGDEGAHVANLLGAAALIFRRAFPDPVRRVAAFGLLTESLHEAFPNEETARAFVVRVNGERARLLGVLQKFETDTSAPRPNAPGGAA